MKNHQYLLDMWCFANDKAVQLLKFGKGKKVTWIKSSLYNRNHHNDASTSSRQPDTRHRDRSYPSSLYIMYSVHLHCTHTVCYVTPFAYIKSESVHDCGFGWQKTKGRYDNNKQNVTLVMVFWGMGNLQFLANTFCYW